MRAAGEPADILVFGTGMFAARIVADIAAVADGALDVVIAGRNPERLDWLRTAAGARAVIFGRAVTFATEQVDLGSADAAAEVIGRHRPRVVVQAASLQTSAVISASSDGWRRLVAEGGLSVTAVAQAMLSLRVAEAIRSTGSASHFINACFPDVVNSLLVARGHVVDSGVGNVAILANAFAAAADVRRPGALKMIAHYQNLAAFRRRTEDRSGPMPRVWIADHEIADVAERFRDVKLTTEPAIEISGASGVMLMLAMAAGRVWHGHVPGPNGLPGGYPVVFANNTVSLDLPAGLTVEDAVAWNRRFEETNGMVVDADGRVQFCGRLHDLLQQSDAGLAAGFHVSQLDAVHMAFKELRTRLETNN